MSDGILLSALDKARDMLAECSAWEAIADQNKIYYDALPPADPGPDYDREQLSEMRPFAVMWHDVSGGFRLDVATADACFPIPSGRIIIQIEIETPAEHASDPTALARHVNKLIGNLIRSGNDASPGLWELARVPGNLPIESISVDGFLRTPHNEVVDIGDACVFELTIDWGRQR